MSSIVERNTYTFVYQCRSYCKEKLHTSQILRLLASSWKFEGSPPRDFAHQPRRPKLSPPGSVYFPLFKSSHIILSLQIEPHHPLAASAHLSEIYDFPHRSYKVRRRINKYEPQEKSTVSAQIFCVPLRSL